MKMDRNIKGISSMTIKKAMGNITIKMETITRDNGKKICVRAKESRFTLMVLFIMGYGCRIRKMEKVI